MSTVRRPSRRAIALFSALAAIALTGLIGGMMTRRLAASPPAFDPGNLVIYRVGTGVASGAGSLVNTGSPVFVDEYTPGGTLVQSIALPTTVSGSNKRLISSGTATSEGLMSRSTDGRYLVLTGYDAPMPTAGLAGTTSASVNRVVGRIDASGTVDTTTGLADYATGNNPRGAASTDGSSLWVTGGVGGIRYATFGTTTSTQLHTPLVNLRSVNIFDGQLYISTASGTAVRVGTVGAGTPTTSGQTITNLPGLSASTGSPYGFFLADLSGSVAGVDTLYVANDDAVALTKYSLVSGSWTANGTVGVAGDAYRGLTGVVNGTAVSLFATRKGGSNSSGGGELVVLTDTSGYNGAFTAVPALLATAAANTAFRGVAFAPQSTALIITQQPASQNIQMATTAALSVSAASGTGILSYQWYQGPPGDTSIPVGTNASTFTTPALSVATDYWVRVGNGSTTLDSDTATITPQNLPTIDTQPISQAIPSGSTATMTVAASGDAPITYQWYGGPSGNTSNPIGGETGTSYTTPALFATTSYWVRVTNNAGSVDSQTATITVTAPTCSASTTPIHDIQGSGAAAAITGTVTVKGVVVGDYEGPSPALRGFYLQEQVADANPATSEGIFIFEGSNANTVSVGQIVQVTGTAEDFQDLTEINASSIELCGSTASPAPVDVTLPVPAAVAGVPYLERFEGMLVRFHQTLYVTEMFQLGRFGQVVMSSGARLPQPTSIATPGAAAQAQQTANDLNKIIIDDELQSQNPDPIKFGRGGLPLSASNTLRGGDTATDIVGVLTYTWAGNSASGNAYRLRPIGALNGGVPNFVAANTRPTVPPTVGGTLKVVGMNVLNYFLTLDSGGNQCGPVGFQQDCRGANSASELTRQQDKLNEALETIDADVIGLSELENTTGVEPAADIVTRLNASLAPNTYGYVDTGVVGTDAIRVGIIYKPGKVTPFGGPVVDLDSVHNRPPVAQTFTDNVTGERFTVVANHFKSKGSCPGSGLDTDQGDGQGCWNVLRTQQAQRLASWVTSTVVPAASDPDVILLGDFNSYAKEDPITSLVGAGYTNLASRFSGALAYSYVFDGQWGYLDHALASSSLMTQVTGAADYHINADEPSVLDYNTDFKSAGQIISLYSADQYRIADHDPVVIGLSLHPAPNAVADNYSVESGESLTIGGQGVLGNDTGGPLTVFNYTQPSHGTLSVNADGSFVYTPAPGFFGTDSFEYTASNASPVRKLDLFTTSLPPLATIGGVNLTAWAFGSALARVPGTTDKFYGLTDRGPNVDGPGGTKVEPTPSFVPKIARFRLEGGEAVLESLIPLMAPDGVTPYSGHVNSLALTGEVHTDLNGNVLPTDPNGYDTEGLVAAADGTFWVSDEYGPFILHLDATGKEIGRLSPFDDTLPRELARRVLNRGMEGLTITPDGTTLVAMMQSALEQTDLGSLNPKKLTPVRIVTYRIADGDTHEYLYLLDNPNTNDTAVSEITALSNTQFLVLERDGDLPPGAYKKLFMIDIAGATDVGPESTVAGSAYDGTNGGLLISGSTIENLLRSGSTPFNTATSTTTLAGVGITPVAKSLHVDLGDALDDVDSQGRFFGHDKIEGIAILDGGATLVIANDSDFGIDGVTNGAPPFALHAKIDGAGLQDEGEILVMELVRSTTTVTIDVDDTTQPAATITSMPTNPTESETAGFTFDGSDSGSGVASFECSLDGAPFTACSSPLSYPSVTTGPHTFSVRAIDHAGLTGAADTHAWVRQAAAVVTFGPAPTPTYPDGNFTVSATTTNTDNPALTYSVVSGPCALVSVATFSSSGVGVCRVQASGAASTNFTAASATQDITITAIGSATVVVVTPNGGEKRFVGAGTVATWAISGATSVDVALSKNGGTTFAAIPGCVGLAGSTTSCAWTPTAPTSTSAKIKVTAHTSGADVSDISDAVFTIVNGTPSINVTSPNTPINWTVDTLQSIAWNHNLGQAAFVKIELTRNGGASWETLTASVQNTTATSGTFPWTVTGSVTTNARIRVTALDGPAVDSSNTPFSIVDPVITVTAPNTAVSWRSGTSHNVTFTHNLGTGQLMNIDVSRNGGTTWSPVGTLTTTSSTSGSYPWLVNGPATTQASIRVSSASSASVSDTSDTLFTITSRINVTAPNTALVWAAGSIHTLTWTHNLGAGSFVNIEFSADNGGSWTPLASGIANTTATAGGYTATMPNVATLEALIRVSSAASPLEFDVSDVPFTLVTPTVTVTSPNTPVNWRSGTSHNITFTHNLGIGYALNIELSRDNGATWTLLTTFTTTSATAGSYPWLVNGPATTQAQVRVRKSDGSISDTSDTNFIITPRINVTSPNTALTWSAGSLRMITWTHNLGVGTFVNIAFSPDHGGSWISLANGVPNATATAGSATVTMPGTATTNALIRVSAAGGPLEFDDSDVPFTLAAPAITVTSPNTNVAWAIGAVKNITWSHNLGTLESVLIEVSRDSGATWASITTVANTGQTTGTYAWTVSGPATTQARIRVTSTSNASVVDASDANFRIQ